jgi:plasmid stabilization system protein ParE
MSQLERLSKEFRESLRGMGDSLASHTSAPSVKPQGIGLVRAFFEGPVVAWYEKLDTDDKAEVDRLFGELNDLGGEDVLRIMEADRRPTPFNLVASLFGFAKKS